MTKNIKIKFMLYNSKYLVALFFIFSPLQQAVAKILTLSEYNKSSYEVTDLCDLGNNDLTLRLYPQKTLSEFQVTIPARLKPADESNETDQMAIITITQGINAQPLQTLQLNAAFESNDYSSSLCAVMVKDFNFDGYLDIALPRASGENNVYQFWLFDSSQKKYRTTPLAKDLSILSFLSLDLNTQKKQLSIFNMEHNSSTKEFYVIKNNKLLLIRDETSTFDEKLDKSVTTIRELKNGRMQIKEQTVQ